ncbi:MAG TPA: L-threonylcarbamoyladenylate synthase [Anaerolineaceae bacterium]|nr:L-threonylcarbamoyladenylate synthase [Anaerolineaceae bacterium]HPN50421.1 L-threonylcarbamoyladenylate synthase [Anaerolineaceae bacterium]
MTPTPVLKSTDPQALPQAVQTLQRGGLVVFPTDTVYGLGVLISLPAAIERIFEAKGRDAAKAIPVLLGSLDHLPQITPGLPARARELAQRHWPGALTLVVARRPELPEALSPTPTVGIRMPDHPFALDLLRRTGPLAVTSANLSGGANPLSAADALAQLDGRVDLIIDGGTVPGGLPSTVVDCTADKLAVLRQGPIFIDA